MDDIAAASALMQVIDILSHEQEIARPGRLEPREGPMSLIRLNLNGKKMSPPGIVELVHAIRICLERLRSGHVLEFHL